jgi:copper chaperone CopZ
MKLMGILNIFCISPSSSALCFSAGRRYLQRQDSQISEHTQLLLGQSTSAVVEVRASDLLRATNVQPITTEEQDQTLRKNPEVVVLRVSLHCHGCARKVSKHISKMEGVTSFAIDLEKKKVTVMGDISPIGVLESVCKVKNAEFWPQEKLN